MKVKKKIMLLLAAVLCIVGIIPVYASVSLPSVSSGRPIKCYTLKSSGRIYAYTAANLRSRTGGYIDCATDECSILQISGNAVQVKYPVSGGTRTAWFARNEFSSCNLANGAAERWTQNRQVTTYRRADGRTSYGYISAGDTCYKLSESGNYKQVIYPVSGGYKMGWIVKNTGSSNNANDSGSQNSNNGNIVVGNRTLDYALGDYFTDNGKACTTCHGGHGERAYTNENYCNCKCTAKIGNKTYKLGSIQCMGFVRYVQSVLYGTNPYLSAKSFERTGSVSTTKLTANKIKSLITNAGVGAHIRTGTKKEHSMIVSKVTRNGFTVIQCNGVDNENYTRYSNCRIGTTTYTWNSYKNSTYGRRGIKYIETCKN